MYIYVGQSDYSKYVYVCTCTSTLSQNIAISIIALIQIVYVCQNKIIVSKSATV